MTDSVDTPLSKSLGVQVTAGLEYSLCSAIDILTPCLTGCHRYLVSRYRTACVTVMQCYKYQIVLAVLLLAPSQGNYGNYF